MFNKLFNKSGIGQEALPTFRYHPDPIATGSIVPSDVKCICCNKKRGYIYVGPIYAEEDLDDEICPWCIASGDAAKKFDASFTDVMVSYIDGKTSPSNDIIEEIKTRTPGYYGWQQEEWRCHCNDGAAFLGSVGKKELLEKGPQEISAIQDDTGLEGEKWDFFFNALNKDDSPTAYLFQCLHCGQYVGYADCD